MENSNLTVKLEPGTDELTIRTGEASKPVEQRPVKIQGNIFAPGNYFEANKGREEIKREDFINKINEIQSLFTIGARVELDPQAGTILLVWNENNSLESTCKGEIKPSKILESFRINTGNPWTLTDLAKQIRFNLRYFSERAEARTLQTALETFKVKVQKDIEGKDDRRGNKNSLLQKSLESDLAKSFNLRLPIFAGIEQPFLFTVEIYFEEKNDTLAILLESPELAELQDMEKKNFFEAEAERFGDIPKIWK